VPVVEFVGRCIQPSWLCDPPQTAASSPVRWDCFGVMPVTKIHNCDIMPVFGFADGVSSPDIAISIELGNTLFLDVPLYSNVLGIVFSTVEGLQDKGTAASRTLTAAYGLGRVS
jgi:hypothetical protein